MSFTAAASGLVVFLLSVQVIQGQSGWGVTYTSTEICAVTGSTVVMSCSYRYPSSRTYYVERTFWFTKEKDGEPVDLRSDSQYAGRVQYSDSNNFCTLRIRDVRESDSADYKFSIITTHPGGSFTGSPGVTLSVTDLQVQVSRSGNWVHLKCHSSCVLRDGRYLWYKNGQKIQSETSSSYYYSYYYYSVNFNAPDDYSCAVRGNENRRSPSVYGPKLPSVSVSPSAEIEEGRSVTLSCSSDANPAANYTWYKENGNLKPLSEDPQLVFSSLRSSDSGQYQCTVYNKLGMKTSKSISIDVKYGPKLPSVSVSPSAEIEEGSSVTLSCSSDANPAANYTWYKEDEDSPKESGQNFTITDFRSEHSGNYCCVAQNSRGRRDSTLQLTVGAGNSRITMTIIRSTLVVLLLIYVILLNLWTRKKKALSSTTEAHDPVEIELDSCPEYENVSDTAAQTEDTEEQEDLV
ncbi:B-cell receptor CD22-like isoform X4 [Cottoperca gobio]|uniref:B-cell receptor CD22-like isoform X4 n=1 Tax=Cottoperca gobio TaxID=56716 RepID=A0A6J2PF09_COTGO|nr:B-cell receptor CD22-like isoform X4 [Cottoperca gobio]